MGFFQSSKPGLIENLDLKMFPLRTDGLDTATDRTSHAKDRGSIHGEESADVTPPQERILALYDEYRPRLLRYLGSLQLTRDQAEEMIQETFLRLTTELVSGKRIENVQGWIVRVSHNLAIDLLKKTERDAITNMDLDSAEIQDPLVDPHAGPYENYEDEERLMRIEAAMKSLSPQQRQCFQMRTQGFRFKDMALALGISEQRAALVVKQAAVRLAAVGK